MALVMVESAVGGRGSTFHLLETSTEVVGVLEPYTVGHLLDQEVLTREQALGHTDSLKAYIVGTC